MKSLQQITCDTQTTEIFNNIAGKIINDLAIPLPPAPFPTPFPIPAWFQAIDQTSGTSVGAIYIDQVSDTVYNYSIIITYKLLTAPGCQSNPVTNCQCIQIIKQDKSGVNAPDTTLPPGIITNAISILPIVYGGYGTVCNNCDPSTNYCIMGTCVKKDYVLYGMAIFAGLTFLSFLK